MIQSDENIDKIRQSYARWNKAAIMMERQRSPCKGFTRAQGQRLRQTVLPVCLPRLSGPCRCDLPWDEPRLIRTRWAGRLRTGRGLMASGRSKTRLSRRRRDSYNHRSTAEDSDELDSPSQVRSAKTTFNGFHRQTL